MTIFDHQTLADREKQVLAPFAAHSADSLGRQYPEDDHPYRTSFQRDRERIIHSAAFRRLEYKTQVFVNHEGDNYRTRLTHTIEVAQIARSIARALALNEDLAEAIALAHDLGHTPFGHAGEDALDAIMSGHGGFSHNRQSLRVVVELENRYPGYRGLNLTFEVREGIVKHETVYDRPDASDYHPEWMPTLEAQIVNYADEIAYNSHDLDDGLRGRVFDWSDLEGIQIWDELNNASRETHLDLELRLRRHHIIRLLINWQVTDIVEHATRRIDALGIKSLDDVRHAEEMPMRFSPEFVERIGGLKKFLYDRMYRHYRMVRMAKKAERVIRALFDAYTQEPTQLPPNHRARFEDSPGGAGDSDTVRQVVCDYIAGMTDRYAIQEYKKLFDPFERV